MLSQSKKIFPHYNKWMSTTSILYHHSLNNLKSSKYEFRYYYSENHENPKNKKFYEKTLFISYLFPVLASILTCIWIQWYDDEYDPMKNKTPKMKISSSFIQTKAYKELLQLVKEKRQHKSVVYVFGPSGSGKTTIIHQVIEDLYPEIEVVELDCSNIDESKKKYLNSMNISYTDVHTTFDAQFLQSDNQVLVLHNFPYKEGDYDLTSEKLVDLNKTVFIEIQSVEKKSHENSVFLDGFTNQESKHLLSNVCPKKINDKQLNELISEIGNLPLDIWLAGTTMNELNWESEKYIQMIKKMETLFRPKDHENKSHRRRYIELKLMYENLPLHHKLDLLALSCFDQFEYIPNEWINMRSILNSTATKSEEGVFMLNSSISMSLRYLLNQCTHEEKEAIISNAFDKLDTYDDDKLSVHLPRHIHSVENIISSMDVSKEFKEKLILKLKSIQLNSDIKNRIKLDSKDLISHLQSIEHVFGNTDRAYYYILSVIFSWRVKYFNVHDRIPVSEFCSESVIRNILNKNENLSDVESFIINMYGNEIQSQLPSLYHEIETHLSKYGNPKEKSTLYHNKGFASLKKYLNGPSFQDISDLKNAEKYLKQSVEIRKKFDQKLKIYYANSLLLLGKVLLLENKTQEADEVLNEACKAYIEAFGVNPLKTSYSPKYNAALDAIYYKSLLHPFINFMTIYGLYQINNLDKREIKLKLLKDRILHTKTIVEIVQTLK